MEGFERIPNPKGKGFVWQKTFIAPPLKNEEEEGVVQKARSAVSSKVSGLFSYFGGKSTPVPVGKKVTLTIPEFVIPPDTVVEGMYTAAWPGHSMERHLIRADTSRYIHDDKVGAKERKDVVLTTVEFIKKMDQENGFPETNLRIYDPKVFEGMSSEGFTPIPEGDVEAFLEKRWQDEKAARADFANKTEDGGFSQTGFV